MNGSETTTPGGDKPSRVYYFGTCLVDLFYPGAGMAGMDLLKREGVEVIFPQGQTCCGQPAYNSGHPAEARAVAAQQIRAFPKDIPIVVPSGSCAGMMKTHYPDLFKGDALEDEAKRFAGRVIELTQFLVHVLDIKLRDKGEPVTVTWHSSCHAMREMGVSDEPKKLLAQLGNVTLQELTRERECCGFGGTFSVTHPEVSGAMVRDKVDDVAASGADELLSGDCGCLMNITGHMKDRAITVDGRHIADFLWERTNG